MATKFESKVKSDQEIISTLFNDIYDPSRAIMQQVWWRNVLYYMGEQWIDWHRTLGTFVRRRQDQSANPTPVSNMIRDYVRSIKAMILNKDFDVRIWPNSEDLIDTDAAKVGNSLLSHFDSMNDEAFEDQKELVILFLILFGTSFMRTYPAMDSGEWAIDANGDISKDGDIGNEALLPFNVCLPLYGSILKRKPYIGIKSLKSRIWVEDTFKKLIDADEDKSIVDYQKKLMQMVAQVSPWKGATSTGNELSYDDDDMIVFKELEFQPTNAHPNGRYIIAVGDKIILERDRMPIKVEKGSWEYTITDFHYNQIPGRFWSDPGVNDQISPQDNVNKIDQALIMNRQGLGRTMVLSPSDVELERVNKGSQSILVIKYDSLTSVGAKPEFHKGIALPDQVLRERDNHINSSQSTSGDPKNVMRGSAPTSQPSGALVDSLKEAAEQGHTPDIKRVYRSLKRVYKKELILAQEIYTENRIIKYKGKGNEIIVKKFKGSDLHKNTDVRLELDTSSFSTNSGQTTMMTEMAKSGVFGDLSQDPGVRHELMQKVGLTKYKDTVNIHIEITKRENAVISETKVSDMVSQSVGGNPQTRTLPPKTIPGIFMTAMDFLHPDIKGNTPEIVISPDPIFKMQDHRVCMEYHLRFILSDEYNALPAEVQQAMVIHYDAHNKAKQMQDAEAQQMMQEQQAREGLAKNPAANPALRGQGQPQQGAGQIPGEGGY